MKILVIIALVFAVAYLWNERHNLTTELERTREELRQARVTVEAVEQVPSAKRPEWFNERLHKDSELHSPQP